MVTVEAAAMMVDPLLFWNYMKIHNFFHELKYGYILEYLLMDS